MKILSTFALVLDKGTYDVISMNDENKEKRNKYKENIINLLQPNGKFLIISCNWTQLELKEQFNDCKWLLNNIFYLLHQYIQFCFLLIAFKIVHTIPTPSFQFGGAVGNTISATLYEKL